MSGVGPDKQEARARPGCPAGLEHCEETAARAEARVG
jgi:hypothetical protein